MPTILRPHDEISNGLSYAFYRSVMSRLNDAGVPFLVGGAYALAYFTDIQRNTKDFDVFVKRSDMERALVDIIFSSGNAVATVDDEWFAHAPTVQVLGMEAKLSPAEEMIWSKAFIMERERFDGADVLHVFLRCGQTLDWPRLLRRFDKYYRVLLSHLVMFGFVYPNEHTNIPTWVLDQLLARVQKEVHEPATGHERICRGTYVSRAQYLIDIEQWHYADARLGPQGSMSETEVQQWTAAIDAPPNKNGAHAATAAQKLKRAAPPLVEQQT
jgi:hypothetical protein